MPKAFLSHSSKEKGFARVIADHLGAQRSILDERSFEAGLPTLEEILRTLAESDVFVLLISEAALKSDWVKRELLAAEELLKNGTIARFFPLIIDPEVTYADPRLPDWVRRDYNLKLVTRPTVAARRIEQQLRRLSWQAHPKLKERQRLFVGRNELIREFEQRVDSLDESPMNCLLASGLPGIGRRALIRHCLSKANLVSEAYEAPVISLGDNESIEDFIQRLFDLGFTEQAELSNLLTMSIPDKVKVAIGLLSDVARAREVVVVVDSGAIAAPDGDLSAWFRSVAEGIAKLDRPVLAVAARYRVNRARIRGLPHIFTLEVGELDPSERAGLLKRYAEWSGLSLPGSELQFIAGLLTGLPEQVLYAVDMARDEGLPIVHRESHRIVDFSSQRIGILLAALEANPKQVTLLRLLGEFEFVSEVLILEVSGDTELARATLEQLLALGACEHIGAVGEYLRLNDAVRDYLIRNHELDRTLRKRLDEHLRQSLRTLSMDDLDAADVLAALKAALLRGEDVPAEFLVPSHFLKAVKELYDARGNNDIVVSLAERALANVGSLDPRIVREIRMYKALALARLRDPKFFEEVKLFNDLPKAEYEFLHGFYHRQTGNLARAAESLTVALEARNGMQRARNELARVYLQVEAVSQALPLAKEAHRAQPDNPFYMRTLFETLVRGVPSPDLRAELQQLLEGIERLQVGFASEVFLNAKAQLAAYQDGNQAEAERLLGEAMKLAKEPTYHLLTLCEIRKHFRDSKGLGAVLQDLARRHGDHHPFYGTRIARLQVLERALAGDVAAARGRLPAILPRLPAATRDRIEAEIKELSASKH